ncbi:MAG: hypothetical protein AB1749_03480 [Pseudomonadota bacterium]
MSKLIGGLVAGVMAVAAASPAFSGDAIPARLLAPSEGISVNVGGTHVVGYFVAREGRCALTVVLGESMREDLTIPAVGRRLHVVVEPAAAARLDTADGKSLAFACARGATAMTVKPVERIAYAPQT